MAYNRRDLIGHYIRTSQQTQRPCTHACCRGSDTRIIERAA